MKKTTLKIVILLCMIASSSLFFLSGRLYEPSGDILAVCKMKTMLINQDKENPLCIKSH